MIHKANSYSKDIMVENLGRSAGLEMPKALCGK